MRFFRSDDQMLHDPQTFMSRGKIVASEDKPERAKLLEVGALDAGLERCEAQNYPFLSKASVHSADYLDFLINGYDEWKQLPGAADEILANTSPSREGAGYPTSIVGRAGWHLGDHAAPIGRNTAVSVMASADVALSATHDVLDGAGESYALCRSPGHHCSRDQAAGHCFLNNVAISVSSALLMDRRPAVVDIDVHHGNGTQDIFYDHAGVLTISIHADPDEFYPFYWGRKDERGAGDGKGANINYPLAIGTGEDTWLEVLEQALGRVASFDADILFVALGLDAYEHDPLGAFKISTQGFAEAGKLIGAIDLPVVLAQEGGYISDALSTNLEKFLLAFQQARPAA